MFTNMLEVLLTVEDNCQKRDSIDVRFDALCSRVTLIGVFPEVGRPRA